MCTLRPLDFPGGSAGKESACNAGDLGSIPGLRRSLAEGIGYPLQDSYLGNSGQRSLEGYTVPGIAKESDMTERLTHTGIYKVMCVTLFKVVKHCVI